MEDLSDFQRERIVGMCLGGASVTKTATLFGTLRAAVFKVMMAQTNHAKTSAAMRYSGQKPKLSEMDCHTLNRTASIKLQNYCSKGNSRTFNIHLEDHFHKNSPTRASEFQHPRSSCNC
jgi:hypothetical protein